VRPSDLRFRDDSDELGRSVYDKKSLSWGGFRRSRLPSWSLHLRRRFSHFQFFSLRRPEQWGSGADEKSRGLLAQVDRRGACRKKSWF